MKVELVAYTQSPPNMADKKPIEIIEQTASNCYDSKVKSKGKISANCYKSGHLSVFEFAQFHFHVEGVSRALLAQLTRHRTGKFCVRSQRYVEVTDFKFVTPPEIAADENAVKIFNEQMNSAIESYNKLTEILKAKHYKTFIAEGCDEKTAKHKAQKKAIEDARFVLPNACETTLDVSFDLRNLMHFCNERLCEKAQWEIRKLAQMMRYLVLEVEPDLKPYLVPKCCISHKCNETKPCRKYNWQANKE